MAERGTGPGRGDGPEPVDEDAAWAAIVAGYDEEAPDGGEDGAGRAPLSEGAGDGPAHRAAGGPTGTASGTADTPGTPDTPGSAAGSGPVAPVNRPLGSGITVHPVGIGPRDWSTPEPPGGDDDHFVPPEPPPLPEVDTTTKFAWLAVLGGPLLLLLTVVLQWDMTWWILTLGIGGFLGGFATLVARMNDDDGDDYDDPGRGAVV
ncbi:hypothetical protein [Streptomyces meridianus]|uniref:Uncharacterized protein n=1 Tax=Streptomyces meridianus TaxID=2938945 RepID=A0ABT0X1I5_9ACTN|nr:hypothetical protein [Streptomyces meridianus]MCM2576418.1 hypothetical protein [Streptomyces meridianus]